MSKHSMARAAALAALAAIPFSASAQSGAPAAPTAEAPVPTLPSQAAREEYVPEALLSLSADGAAGVRYFDNVYRSPSNEDGDFAAVLAPTVTLRSHADAHTLRLRARAEGAEYFSDTENNYFDAGVDGKGRYQVNESFAALGHASLAREHVGIGAFVDEPERRLDEPVRYVYAEAGAGFEATPGDARLDAAADWFSFNYENVRRQDGTLAINDDRDYDQIGGMARAGYYVRPGVLAYGKGLVNQRDYDNRIDNTAAFGLDSEGHTLLAGVEFGDRKTDAFWVDANVGYLEQDYDASFRPDIDDFAANADLLWRASPKLTVTGLLARTAEEANLTGASGYLRTEIGGAAEYRLDDPWAVTGHLRYTNYDFEVNPASGQIQREDDVVDASLGVRYYFLEHYNVGVEYGYVTRDSNDATLEYDANTLFARIGVDY